MTVHWTNPPTPELPPAIGPDPSPLWPQHLVDLFVRPTHFFTGQLALGKMPYVVLVTWVLGMSSVLDRIDTQIARAEASHDPTRWQALASDLGPWPHVWTSVIGGGVVAGALVWWVGGWWCRVRLRWSGARAPDKRLARLLLIYSSFVFAGPAVLALAAQTLLYPSYLAAHEAAAFSALGMVMIFWSLLTTYWGALALFPVTRGRAQLWFVGLPAVFYFLLLGGTSIFFSGTASAAAG